VTATQYYPALSLTGSLGSSATSLGDVLRNPVATLGAGLSLPFLNLQRAQLDTDIAGTAYQIAATNFRKTLYTALSEVDNALSAREQLARQVAASQASYDEAVEVERAQEVRYRVVPPTCAPGWKRSRPGVMPSCRWRACARAS
jgi:outer membrane protein TolC